MHPAPGLASHGQLQIWQHGKLKVIMVGHGGDADARLVGVHEVDKLWWISTNPRQIDHHVDCGEPLFPSLQWHPLYLAPGKQQLAFPGCRSPNRCPNSTCFWQRIKLVPPFDQTPPL